MSFSGLIFVRFPPFFFSLVCGSQVCPGVNGHRQLCPQMALYEGVFNESQQFGCRMGIRTQRPACWYRQRVGVRAPKRTSANGENSGMLAGFDKTPAHPDCKACCLWLQRAALASHTESSNVQSSFMWFIAMTYFGILMV